MTLNILRRLTCLVFAVSAVGLSGCIESDYDLSEEYRPVFPIADGKYLYRQGPNISLVSIQKQEDHYLSDRNLLTGEEAESFLFWVYNIEAYEGFILKTDKVSAEGRTFLYLFSRPYLEKFTIFVLTPPGTGQTWEDVLSDGLKKLVTLSNDDNPFIEVHDPANTVRALEEAGRQSLSPIAVLQAVEDVQIFAPNQEPALAPSAKISEPGRRIALVIGNSDYANAPRLPNPVSDATLVANALRTAGFSLVIETDDLSREQMLGALRSFAREADNADWAMIYYAGHGMELEGTNYLIPTDARLASDRDLQDEAISLDRVLSAVEGASKLRVVVLDACRENPFALDMQRTFATRSISRGLARVEPTGGTMIAYAAREGTLAEDGDGANSPYAMALAERLTTPGVEINMTFRQVRDDVLAATDGQQEPFFYGSLPGTSFYFLPAEPVSSAPPPAAPEQPMIATPEEAPAPKPDAAPEIAPASEPSAAATETPAADAPAGSAPATETTTPPDEMALVSPDAATETLPEGAPPILDPVEFARALQTELKRVGCYSGAIDGIWGAGSSRGVSEFVRIAELTAMDGSPADYPNYYRTLLAALGERQDRVCPLICGVRYRVENDACVLKTCAAGERLGSDGTCRIPRRQAGNSGDGSSTAPRRRSGDCFTFNGEQVCE